MPAMSPVIKLMPANPTECGRPASPPAHQPPRGVGGGFVVVGSEKQPLGMVGAPDAGRRRSVTGRAESETESGPLVVDRRHRVGIGSDRFVDEDGAGVGAAAPDDDGRAAGSAVPEAV